MSLSRAIVIAASMIASGLSFGPASAEEQPSLTAEDRLTLTLKSQIREKDSVADIKEKMLYLFKMTDIDGGGVSESDYELKRQLGSSQSRIRKMTRWLGNDLDGDGGVTRAELEAVFGRKARQPMKSAGVTVWPTETQVAETVSKLVDEALEDDKDNDGTITFTEALTAASDQTPKQSGQGFNRNRPVHLSLDRNGDGTVTENEFTEAVDRLLNRVDENGDGILSTEEKSALAEKAEELRQAARREMRARQFEAKQRELAEGCGFLEAPTDDLVVLLTASRGQALSTVSLGGDDGVVSVANAWVEPGDKPLFVLLVSRNAMIWQFSGSVERIATVLAGSGTADAKGTPRVGVVGIPRDRVHFLVRSDCLKYRGGSEKAQADLAAKVLPPLIGRAAELVLPGRNLSTVSLPVGMFDRAPAYANAVEPPDDSPGAPLWREMLRYNPGGLVKIDAESVVSRAAAKDYVTLPQQAGLAQLLDEGALEVAGTSKVVVVNGTEIHLGGGRDTIIAPDGAKPQIVVRPNLFRITRKIRYPAGLSGAVRFVLAPGVPKPEGSPGSSRIVD